MHSKTISVLFILMFFFLQNAVAQQYKKLHFKSILVDTHNDILSTVTDKGLSMDADLKGITQTDLKRMKEGGIDVQLFSVFCDGQKQNPYAWANREMDTLYAVAKRKPG